MKMAAEMVGYLEVVQGGGDVDETQYLIPVHGSGQFFLGRNETLWLENKPHIDGLIRPNCSSRHAWPDPIISNRHVRIHSILYEQDPISGIPPFVYATDFSSNGTYLRKSNAECTSSQKRGICMGRGGGAFLLDHGDELRLSGSLTLIFRSAVPLKEKQLPKVQEQERRGFSSQYLLTDRDLGVGGYGRVMVAINQHTQRQLACKVIDLRRWWSITPTSLLRRPIGTRDQILDDLSIDPNGLRKNWPSKVAKCFREFDILKDLSHPNIVSVEKVFWSSDTIYIFQELITGGDLFSYLEYKGGRLEDVEAAVVVRQVLKGIKYLHDQDIVHRDLKPDNIMMTSLDDGARIVITDFGNARYLPNEGPTPEGSSRLQRMFSHVGTFEYAAPEIYRCNITASADQGYSKAIDMWSIGSITGTILGGEILFADYRLRGASEGRYCQGVRELASRCDLSVLDDGSNDVWTKVGDRPKDFIKKLLVLEEDDRMTADEALAHNWFSNKFHAAEFEALYERTTRDWRPRPKASNFVEQITKTASNTSPDNVAVGFPDFDGDQETASHCFASPPEDSTNRIPFENTSESPARETNIPLPPTSEDYEGGHDEVGNSMEQIPVDLIYEDKYEADSDMRIQDGSYTEVEDSQYDFSIPAPPPHSPVADDDSVIVVETPMRAVKRFHDLQSDDAAEEPGGEAAEATPTKSISGYGQTKLFAARLSNGKRYRYAPY